MKPSHERLFPLIFPGDTTIQSLQQKLIQAKRFEYLADRRFWRLPMMLSFITTHCWPGTGSARISQKALAKAYTKHDSRRIKQCLRELGLIHYKDHSYKIGEYCILYRCEEPKSQIKWIRSEQLRKKLDEMEEMQLKAFMKKASDAMKWVTTTLLEHTAFNGAETDRLELLKGQLKIKPDGSVIDLYGRNRHAIAKLKGHIKWSPTIGPKGGRLYHPAVILKDFLRDCLVIDGERAVSLDVKSCFPFLALAIYPDNFQEKEKYYQLLQEGFYEWVQSLSEERFSNLCPACQRRKAKEDAFRNIFFSKRQTVRDRWIWDPFCLRFPKLASVMAAEESLAATSQQMEVNAVFGAVSRLQEKQIRCISVHDGLLVPESAADEAAGLLRAEFAKLTGYEPVVTAVCDHLTSGNAYQCCCDNPASDSGTYVRRTAAATGFIDQSIPTLNTRGFTEPHRQPQDITLLRDACLFTDADFESVLDSFLGVVAGLTKGKWIPFLAEAEKIGWSQFALEGLLCTVIKAKAARSDFLAEWSVQTDISAKNCRFRIDHIEQ